MVLRRIVRATHEASETAKQAASNAIDQTQLTGMGLGVAHAVARTVQNQAMRQKEVYEAEIAALREQLAG